MGAAFLCCTQYILLHMFNLQKETKMDTEVEVSYEDRVKDAIGESWYPVLKDLFRPEGRLAQVGKKLAARRRLVEVHPDPENVFRAFRLCNYNRLKVVIFGQDPYHTGCADGLAFSSGTQGYLPPSLRYIYGALERELYNGLSVNLYNTVDLNHWAMQGILLLNTSLTVEHKKPNSHKELWTGFAEAVIDRLRDHPNLLMFVLWGAEAQRMQPLIETTRHKIITARHPASAAYAKKHEWDSNDTFSEIEKFVHKNEYEPIEWIGEEFLPF